MAGPNRNDPCPCGSGKKFKNCHYGAKQVNSALTIMFSEPIVANGFSIGPDGVNLFKDNAVLQSENAWVSSLRERTNGRKKTLTKIRINSNKLHLDELRTLKSYDFVFAIDTNTRPIRNRSISAACFSQCLIGDGEVNLKRLGCFEFHGASEKAENIGWCLLQSLICRSPDYNADASYVIITDSDLGNHERYNRRELALFGSCYLVNNFTIAFATDRGQRIANKIIAECHNGANQILSAIDREAIEEAPPARAGAPFTHFQQLQNSSTENDEVCWFRLT